MQYILSQEEFNAYKEALELKKSYQVLVDAYKQRESELEQLRSENTSLRGRLKDICGIANVNPRCVLRTTPRIQPDLDALAALKATMNEDGTITRQ